MIPWGVGPPRRLRACCSLVFALALCAASAGGEPAPTSVLVKLHSEGPSRLTDCAEALTRSGRALAAATADGSDSLDRLHAELGVTSVRAVFRRPDGTPLEAQRRRLLGRIDAAYARRGVDGGARARPDLSHVYRIELPPGASASRASRRTRPASSRSRLSPTRCAWSCVHGRSR